MNGSDTGGKRGEERAPGARIERALPRDTDSLAFNEEIRGPDATAEVEPTVAEAGPSGWRAWAKDLLARGRDRIGKAGVVLALGFSAGLASLLLFAELAGEVAADATLAFDTAFLEYLQSFASPGLTVFFEVVSFLGGDGLNVLLVLVVGFLLVRRRWGAAVGLFLATGGAHLLNSLLKDAFQRPRPAPVETWIAAQHFSFPSGHAMIGAAFYVFLGYLAWRLLQGVPRIAATAGFLALIVLIALSRVYLGVHYLTDVVAGVLAGFVWADSVIIAGRLLTRRRRWIARVLPSRSSRSVQFAGREASTPRE